MVQLLGLVGLAKEMSTEIKKYSPPAAASRNLESRPLSYLLAHPIAMATSCIRSVSRGSRSSLHSYVKECVSSGSRRSTQFSSTPRTPLSSSPSRFSFSRSVNFLFFGLSYLLIANCTLVSGRYPSELSCCSVFLLPLQSGAALARLNAIPSFACRCYRALSQGNRFHVL